jgi:hypothetical protein
MVLTIDDHLEIQTLVARYNHAVDSGDGEAFAVTFADAGALHVEGREALARFAEGLPDSQRVPRQIASNLLVSCDRDRATAQSYVQMFTLAGDPPVQQVAASGRYPDDLVTIDDRWHFERRVFTPDE